MNRAKGERAELRNRRVEILFWIERLCLLLIVLFPSFLLLDVIRSLILFSSCLALPFFLFFSRSYLCCVGSCGIGGFWLFLMDRLAFYLRFKYSKLLAGGFDLPFLWCLTVCLSIVVHSILLVDHIIGSYQAVPPPPTPLSTDEGDVSKEVEKTKGLPENEKKIMTDVENMIHSALETLKKEWEDFSEEGKKMMMTKADAMEDVICSRFATMRDNLHFNFDELTSKMDQDIEALRREFNKDVKSVADLLHETYLVVQESAKEARTRAAKAHETHLLFQEDQNKRRIIRGEDVEGFPELKEEVRRLSMDLLATRVEAEMAKEELSSAAVELVEAGFQQWEQDNADYLASLTRLC